MTPSFGTRLRLQREQREVALSTIAADTKIKAALLEGLERDDVSQWPGGIFRRAYMRSYAQAIGLDPAAVVREFLELFPDPTEVAPANAEESEAAQPSPNRLRRLVTSAIAAVPALQQAPRRRVAPLEQAHRRGAAPSPAPIPREYVVQPEPVHDAGDMPPAAETPIESRRDALDDDFVLVPPVVPTGEWPAPGDDDLPAPTLADAAQLCTRLGQVVNRTDLLPVLEDAARILDAVGLVVWSWDGRASVLRPSLAHGYPDSVLARLPVVRSDADNAIADAFRSAAPCVVNGSEEVTGAAVIPLMGPAGCVGVLALELRRGGEGREPVRALATILAAQLVALLGSEPLAEAATA